MTSELPRVADVILIGSGLANSVLALFLRAIKPGLRVVLVEQNANVPQSKTWCFHETDLSPEEFEIVKSAVAKSWPAHDVFFPSFQRRIETGYHCILPDSLENALRKQLPNSVFFNSPVERIEPHRVILENGYEITAGCVIDGRGTDEKPRVDCGYQKFVGQYLELEKPHGLEVPILMDATVPQLDGYRFIYVLPWGPTRLLIEDTRYSSSADVDLQEYSREIEKYLDQKSWKVKTTLKTETGVLPIPLGKLDLPPSLVPQFGTAGGHYHPVTGYSLPRAAKLATEISALEKLTTESVRATLESAVHANAPTWKYFCWLNRMMFEGASAKERYRIFQRFYTLNHGLIGRFYSGKIALKDKVRLVLGKPPVPVTAAFRCLWSVKT